MQAQARVAELCLVGGKASAYVTCDLAAIPPPGRYLLAHALGSDAPLSTELFSAESRSNGFVVVPPVPGDWRPGSVLNVRGPLGKGFQMPASARRVALIAFDGETAPLLALVEAAARQQAAVALVCDDPPSDLPLHLEVNPLGALGDVLSWADYSAFELQVGSLTALQGSMAGLGRNPVPSRAEALVRAPMPCGGLADCGVCTVRTVRGPKLACVDGPVFDLRLLIGKS